MYLLSELRSITSRVRSEPFLGTVNSLDRNTFPDVLSMTFFSNISEMCGTTD